MAYIRNPRLIYCWESDDEPPWGKYRAADGTFHGSGNEADAHDKQRGMWPWTGPSAAPLGREGEE